MHEQAALPPPVFTYDPAQMPDLLARIRHFDDYDQLPAIGLRQTYVGRDAILDLPEIVRRLVPGSAGALLVMDETPMHRGGDDLKALVPRLLATAGLRVHTVVLKGDQHGSVHPDFHQVESVRARLQPGAPVISLGSGVVTDVTKHACHLFDQERPGEPATPLVCCATANSVPAYASQMAIISRDGVKRTWPSRLPDVIIQDLQILCDCPRAYTMGGIGDMCAMFTSFADWYLGAALGLSTFLDAPWRILEDVRALMFPYAGEIGRGTPLGMEVLAKILTLGGLAMSLARDSVPLSGYEHVVSHMLDMSAECFGRSLANHGSQVAVAGITVLVGQRMLLERLKPEAIAVEHCFPDPEVMEKRVKDTFAQIDPSGAMGAECWRDYRAKLEGWHTARPQLEEVLRDWPRYRAQLEMLMGQPKDYIASLFAAGHPTAFSELNVSIPDEQALWAYHNAHLMRKRFSTGDLIFYLGWFNESWSQSVFARAAELQTSSLRETDATSVRQSIPALCADGAPTGL